MEGARGGGGGGGENGRKSDYAQKGDEWHRIV